VWGFGVKSIGTGVVTKVRIFLMLSVDELMIVCRRRTAFSARKNRENCGAKNDQFPEL